MAKRNVARWAVILTALAGAGSLSPVLHPGGAPVARADTLENEDTATPAPPAPEHGHGTTDPITTEEPEPGGGGLAILGQRRAGKPRALAEGSQANLRFAADGVPHHSPPTAQGALAAADCHCSGARRGHPTRPGPQQHPSHVEARRRNA